MTFLNPNLLWAGLACIALPIIVHLLTRRRRKPVEWGAMRFLLEAYRKHKRRLTLEQFLLLAARCALVALVALALGKPVLGSLTGTSGPGPRTVVLAIDNSLTSGALDAEGKTALSANVERARKLLDTLEQARGDRAGLLALGAPSQVLVMPPSTDIAGVKRQLESLEVTESRTDLAAAAGQVRSELFEGANPAMDSRIVFALFSDWRAGSADVERSLPLLAPQAVGTERPLVLATVPALENIDNISVVGIEPLRTVLLADDEGAVATESGQVRVHLKRTGPTVERAAASMVTVKVDRADRPTPDVEPARTTANWSPGQREISIPLSVGIPALDAGSRPVITATIDNDAIPGDNTYRRPIELRRVLQIGVISGGVTSTFGPGDWVRLAIKPDAEGAADSSVRVVEIDPRNIASPGQLTGIDAIFVVAPDLLDRAAWERCASFCANGGLVVVSAAATPGAQLWTDDFVQTFGLPWRIARESKPVEPAATLADPAAAASRPDPDILALLAGEIAELARPVHVSRVLPVESAEAPLAPVLALADGTPFLLAARPVVDGRESGSSSTRGLVVFFTSAPEATWTDLPTKPLMLPLVQEIVRQGVGAARSQWMGTAGQMIRTPSGAIELRPLTREDRPLPITTPELNMGARFAGVWAAADARGSTLEIVAINPDADASDTSPQPRENIGAWLAGLAGPDHFVWMESDDAPSPGNGPPSSALPPDESAPPFSPDLLLGALAVALIEMVMARWFSHATVVGKAAA